MKRSEVRAWLNELYAQVPAIKCKGFCKDTCGSVDMHPEERRAIKERGVTIPPHAKNLKVWRETGDMPMCPALTPEGACSVYEVRPMICRTWGVSEDAPCPYGCEMEGEKLSFAKHRALLYISLGDEDRTMDELMAYFSDPKIERASRAMLKPYDPSERPSDGARRALIGRVALELTPGVQGVLGNLRAAKRRDGQERGKR